MVERVHYIVDIMNRFDNDSIFTRQYLIFYMVELVGLTSMKTVHKQLFVRTLMERWNDTTPYCLAISFKNLVITILRYLPAANPEARFYVNNQVHEFLKAYPC